MKLIISIFTICMATIFLFSSCNLAYSSKNKIEKQEDIPQAILNNEDSRNDHLNPLTSSLDNNSIISDYTGNKITSKAALDLLFNYIYTDKDKMQGINYYEYEQYVGYNYVFDLDGNTSNPWFLESAGVSPDNVHQLFCVGERVKDSDGNLILTHYNAYFAVNIRTGEIITEKIYDKNGDFTYNEEYIKINK